MRNSVFFGAIDFPINRYYIFLQTVRSKYYADFYRQGHQGVCIGSNLPKAPTKIFDECE